MFSDGTGHRYEKIPDSVTPDMIEARVNKDFPGKRITNIDGGKGPSPKSNITANPENYKNADWEISCKTDPITDKKDCVIWMITNHRVQCNPEPGGGGSLFAGAPARQTPAFIYTRVDNDPVSSRLPTKMEEQIAAAEIPLSSLQGKSRLRVRLFSVLHDNYDFDINLSTLQDAIQQALKIK